MRATDRILTTGGESGLLSPGDHVVVACSGGADSVALLLLLVATAPALGLAEVSVAHLDHGLRDGSRDDAAFVRALAARLGLRAEVRRRQVRPRRGESPEAAARRVRYAFLASAARRLGGTVVATAHHMDDQAETILYRVVRGAGLAGLRGILPATRIAGVRVVRPLLGFRRDELRRWLRARGETWREDPTNTDGNDRARLRNEVIPLLSRVLGRDPAAPLARLARIAQEGFARPAPAARGTAITSAMPTPEESGSRRAATLTWETIPASNAAFLERIRAAPGAVEILDADRVVGALTTRRPSAGDRFQVLGMPQPQRLSHFLQRRGVPASARAAVPLLCDAEGIVCVGGHGIAARVAVGNDTSRVVVTRLVQD